VDDVLDPLLVMDNAESIAAIPILAARVGLFLKD
jgi:hypothetical protein